MYGSFEATDWLGWLGVLQVSSFDALSMARRKRSNDIGFSR